jgi:hypothetical protein
MVKPVVPWHRPGVQHHYTPAFNCAIVPIRANIKYRYDKKFALFPIRCKDGYWTWFNHYYKKYLVFSYIEIEDVCYYQYKLTEEDAVVEKLSDNIDFR